jgi:DNA-binding IclR family transcriptional regulator
MSDFKPRPGTFLPYMEYRNREKLAQRALASPLTLLEILARQPQQSLSLFELQEQSDMDPSRYGDALKSLRNAGYIEFVGEGFEGVVQLTPGGAQVVQLARPA